MPVPDKQGCWAPRTHQLAHAPRNETEKTFLSAERGTWSDCEGISHGWLMHPVHLLWGSGSRALSSQG